MLTVGALVFAMLAASPVTSEKCSSESAKSSRKQFEYLQRQVDAGHQPWRLDSRMVAQAVLSEWLKKNPSAGSGTKVKETSSREQKLVAVYIYDLGLETVKLHLKRRNEKAIWLVERIDHCFQLPISSSAR
jgi:hypothetical protein